MIDSSAMDIVIEHQQTAPPLLQNLLAEQSLGALTGDNSLDINGRRAEKRRTGNWQACYYIIGTEFWDVLAFNGIAANLVTYLMTVLGESNSEAARDVSVWMGTCFLTPLLGAFVADSYLGRYWGTVAFASIYILGVATSTLSALLSTTDGASDQKPAVASDTHNLMFYAGLYMIAVGSGGVKPCLSTFGANQFDDTDPVEQRSVGPYFNWYCFTINVGLTFSRTVLVWLQDRYGWKLGFSLSAACVCACLGLFLLGSWSYRFQIPGGSPFTRLCQVIAAAVRNAGVVMPEDKSLLYELPAKSLAIGGNEKLEHTSEFEFFDRAAITGGGSSPWRLCTVTQVEELKALLRLLSIWATVVPLYAFSSQVGSTFLEQGNIMDRRVGPFSVPPAALYTCDVLTVVIVVPIYERFFVPVASRFTGHPRGLTHMQRIGIGLFFSILSMVTAAMMEMRRLEIARAGQSMSILWQLPQYFLFGLASVFADIGQVEFFYDQAPGALRSLCVALTMACVSAGNYLNSVILMVVTALTTKRGQPGWLPDDLNNGHLDLYFWVLAALGSANLVVFCRCAKRYKAKPMAQD